MENNGSFRIKLSPSPIINPLNPLKMSTSNKGATPKTTPKPPVDNLATISDEEMMESSPPKVKHVINPLTCVSHYRTFKKHFFVSKIYPKRSIS